MAHYIFYSPKSCGFILAWLQMMKACIVDFRRVAPTSFSVSTQPVFVGEGGKQELGRERRNQRHRGKKTHLKYIKVYGYICRFNVTFIIRSQQDALSDRSGWTKIGICLHWHRILQTWYGSGRAHIVIGSQWMIFSRSDNISRRLRGKRTQEPATGESRVTVRRNVIRVLTAWRRVHISKVIHDYFWAVWKLIHPITF